MRLIAVTQVTTPDPLRPVTHNRLTHSLKVAQIARTIAGNLVLGALQAKSPAKRRLILRLGGLDASTAEAAGLVHDIGHPPFGHAGETVLDQIIQDRNQPLSVEDGFEGNAQSFRFATRTEPMFGTTESYGLNLTAATRCAILKYPWLRPTSHHKAPADLRPAALTLREKKFGYYRTEIESFRTARDWLPEPFKGDTFPRQSLEASIMDIADDITYAVHDYEDFVRLGLIIPEVIEAEIRAFLKEPTNGNTVIGALGAQLNQKFERYETKHLASAARIHLDTLPSIRYQGFTRRLRNNLLEDLISAAQVHEEPIGDVGAHVALRVREWHLVELLKFLVQHYVIENPSLALIQAGQAEVLRAGVRLLEQWVAGDKEVRIPAALRARRQWASRHEGEHDRAMIDYICSLGDIQFQTLVHGMQGIEIGGFTGRD